MKGGPLQLKPSVGCTVEMRCAGDGAERKTHGEQLHLPGADELESPVEAELERRKWAAAAVAGADALVAELPES